MRKLTRPIAAVGALLALLLLTGAVINPQGVTVFNMLYRGRSLFSKLGDTVSVKDFGAVGDGVTDDTAAIQAAVTTGHGVFFPSGIYKVTSTVTAQSQGAWIGEGQGNTFDSTGGAGISMIRCSGALSPCVVPPREMRALHFDGVDKTGTGLTMGADDGTFVSGVRWSNVTFRSFNIAIQAYNFFLVNWTDLVVQGGHTGIQINPTVTTPDGGYFTSTAWKNLYIADNDTIGLNVVMALSVGTKTWTWENIIIERNATAGTTQAQLTNVILRAHGLYMEGTSGVPSLKATATTLVIDDAYINGTGGWAFGSSTARIYLSNCNFVTATDVFTGLSANTHMVVRDNSNLQTDPRPVIGGRADVQESTVPGGFLARPRSENQITATYGTTVTLDMKQGNAHVVTPTDAVNFTVTFTGATQGQIVYIRIKNTTGGALGVLTWNGNYHLQAAWVQPATANSRFIAFYHDGTVFMELFRSAGDVAN